MVVACEVVERVAVEEPLCVDVDEESAGAPALCASPCICSFVAFTAP